MKAKEIMKKISIAEKKNIDLQLEFDELYKELGERKQEIANKIKKLFQLENVSVYLDSDNFTIKQNNNTILLHYANRKEYDLISEELYNTIVKMYEDEFGKPTYVYSDISECKSGYEPYVGCAGVYGRISSDY